VTLTSQRGYIPLTFQNASGHVVNVVVKFVADRRLRFTAGPTKRITLASRVRTLTFPVRALVHGRIPFKVVIETSGGGSGPDRIAQRDLIIRSTAYNRLALFVTIGAAIFLLGWWGRRFVPRRRS